MPPDEIPAKETPVMTGSLELNPSTPASGSPETKVETPKILHSGLVGDITDQESLLEYTRSLEKKVVAGELKSATRADMPGEQPVTTVTPQHKSIEEEIEETIFTDTKGSLQKYRQHILSEVDGILHAKDRRQKFWDTFYQENPDLKALDRIVQLVEKDKLEELKPLKISDARKKLAEETRKVVALSRGRRETSEELPQGGAAMLESGGGSAPRKEVEESLNFVAQVRQFQRGRARK